MKKNISINISGIIFHIEEDGYEVLKSYLESINSYFSSFDDNNEIIADIESRIAEIFLSKLNEGKQVITLGDVESLKATMGSVRDFQAVEEPEMHEESTKEENFSSNESKQRKSRKSNRLYRDGNNRVLGGVASGLANYFGIDSLWIRLLIVILALGTGIIPVVIVYIVMWAVIPESDRIKEENKGLKRMFRNPENKVFGGVASGMAAYFGVDVAIIRLLFVIAAILGLAGIAIYIVLWIIVPEAKTITDKVQMEGEPVTLSNIESNIKKNLNVNEGDEESVFIKILLFPFRLLGMIFSGLGKVLGPLFTFLAEALRILFGIFIVLTSLGLLLGFVVTAGVLLGLFAGGSLFGIDIHQGGFPIYLFSESFSVFAVLVSLVAVIIPTLVFLILGTSVIAKRNLLPPAAGWSFFGIWILAVIGLSLVVPQTIYQFKENGEYKETETYQLNGKTAVLTLHETGFEAYDAVTLELRGHEESAYKLVKEFESRGSTRREAIENAKLVNYVMEIKDDSVFIFDSNITFDHGSQFRGQDLDMTLYIPYNQPFVMDYDLRNIIRNTIYRHGYSVHDMDDENIWIFTPAGLECTTCDKEISRYEPNNRYKYNRSGHSRAYENEGFTSIEIGSAFEAEIEHGTEYSLKLVGDEGDIDEVRVMQEGESITFEYADDDYSINNRNHQSVKLVITTPTLVELVASGASKVYVSGFDGDKLYIVQSGASFCSIDADYADVEAEVVGASELILKGQGEEFKLDVRGASEVNAYNYQVKYAEVDAAGISDVRLYVTDQIVLDASLVSEVKYRGGAELVTSNED